MIGRGTCRRQWLVALVIALVFVSCGDGEPQPDRSLQPQPLGQQSQSSVVAEPAHGPDLSDAVFVEDFGSGDSLSRFDFDVYHRDEVLGAQDSWPGDHAVTGPNDLCGPPEDKRVVTKGVLEEDFNDEWIYRCVPGGDLGKGHLMTSIGDASGYSIGAFTPTVVFEGVREVRWSINLTDLGERQFPEVKIIPAGVFDFQNLPCAVEWLPCKTTHHGDLSSVGISFMNQALTVNTGGAEVRSERWTLPWMYESDPAVTSLRTRRAQFFRDNGDGTLTYGVETPGGEPAASDCGGLCAESSDGSFFELTVPGAFPEGPVRVVFADHNYTPSKTHPETFTWHWDDIEVLS